MRKIAAILLLFLSLQAAEQAQASFFFKSKKALPTAQAEADAQAQFAQAQSLENDGKIKSAIGLYKRIPKRFPSSKLAAPAQYKAGALYESLGALGNAIEAYDLYLKNYPDGDEFDQVIQSEFRIGRIYLNGGPKGSSLSKVYHILGSPAETAQKIFQSLLASSPYGKYAPEAQFDVGLAFERQDKYPEAIQAYQAVVDKFPHNPLAADAQYQIAYVYYFQVNRGSHDPEIKNKAIQSFEDFLFRFPSSEKTAQAKTDLKRLTGSEAQSLFRVARFYDQGKQYKAAAISYNQVIQQYPDSPEAKISHDRIAELKKQVGESALALPKPETGAAANAHRVTDSKVNTTGRPDFNGPPVAQPTPTPSPNAANQHPAPRASTQDAGPIPAADQPLPPQ